jgi:hypothetical protein
VTLAPELVGSLTLGEYDIAGASYENPFSRVPVISDIVMDMSSA